MADTRLTKVSFTRATYLCLLAIFRPETLAKESEKDNEKRKKFLMIASASIGFIIGQVIDGLFGSMHTIVITSFQITGALLLLWGTLFVRGWEIQSYGGVTLAERVNKWIYRSLYCIGTTIIICSLVLSSNS